MPHPALPLIHTFRRPAVIAAIVLLLVNDHVLKVYTPSWLTGKLSDFAGLFFFPLLLGALIEFAVKRFKRKADWALPFALAFTGLLFAAIKTIPAANALYTSALGVQVVRDPSDLIALVMLLPAWWAGKSQVGYTLKAPGRAAYAVLVLGALASMASMPCAPSPGVERVAEVGGNIYAENAGRPENSIFRLSNLGIWELIEKPEAEVKSVFTKPADPLPIIICDSSNLLLCYQIDGTAKVLESTDGGQTWHTAWEIPTGRDLFMHRFIQSEFCGWAGELRTFDIAMLPGGVVVAAVGSEGVVVRDEIGTWRRMGIEGYIEPTPLVARNLAEAANALKAEFILSGAVSLLVYTVLSIWARRRLPRPGWALHPGLFVLPILLAGLAVLMVVSELDSPSNMVTQFTAFFAMISLGIMLLVMGLTVLAEPEGERRSAGGWAFVAVFSPLIVTMLVFLLWSYGAIQQYWLAAVLAVILTTFAVVLAVGRWRARAAPPATF